MHDPASPTNALSRRSFLEGLALGTGAATSGVPLLSAAEQPPAAGPRAPDFTDHSAALQPDTVVASACQFCNSLCGLKVHLKAGRVIDIRGEDRDPVQA